MTNRNAPEHDPTSNLNIPDTVVDSFWNKWNSAAAFRQQDVHEDAARVLAVKDKNQVNFGRTGATRPPRQ